MSVRSFREGIRLVPVSSDPLLPAEGQLQYSDGTVRDEGVYVFTNGSWVSVGGTVGSEPKEILLDNPKFEVNTTGWSFTGTGSISRDTLDPLAGDGSLLVRSESVATIALDNSGVVANGDKTSYDFTLDNKVEIGQKIKVNFDFLAVRALGSGNATKNDLVVEIYDVDTSSSLGLFGLEENSPVVVLGTKPNKEIEVQFDTVDDTSTNYRVILHSISGEDGVSGVPDPYFEFKVDNFRISTITKEVVSNIVFDKLYISSGRDLGTNFTSSIFSTVVYNTEVDDAGDDYNNTTGIFTAPRDMRISINASVMMSNQSYSVGQAVILGIELNNVNVKLTRYAIPVTGSNIYQTNIDMSLPVLQGDTIKIVLFQNSGSDKSTFTGSSDLIYNKLTITEV